MEGSSQYLYCTCIAVYSLAITLRAQMHLFPLPVTQLGVMTYTDMTAQSPETQAAVEHEIRVLLKVCVCMIFFRTAEQKRTLSVPTNFC